MTKRLNTGLQSVCIYTFVFVVPACRFYNTVVFIFLVLATKLANENVGYCLPLDHQLKQSEYHIKIRRR